MSRVSSWPAWAKGPTGTAMCRPIRRSRSPSAADGSGPSTVSSTNALAHYERRNRWLAPVVQGMLSWLVGWHYDGTPSARNRLVRELPIVALRPVGDLQDPQAPDDPAA